MRQPNIIYHHGEHKGIGDLPADLSQSLEVIVKNEYRRCSLRVIEVPNRIRTDIAQGPANNNAQGDVAYIRVDPGDPEAGLQRARDLLTSTLKWQLAAPQARELYLTHRLIARKAGFADLLRIYTERGTFAKETLTDVTDHRIAFVLESISGTWPDPA